MDTTVGAFNCEYRAAGAATTPGPTELEHDLRSHFAPAFADGIRLALGSDRTVYVVRRVDCELTLLGEGRGLPDLTRRMAGAATNAVLRTLSEAAGGSAPSPGEEVVAFADEAEFLAQFIVDLLEDKARSLWYYASFGEALARPRRDALVSVLSSAGPVAMRALGRLFARGFLEPVLGELPPSALARLIDVSEEPSPDVLRPLLNAALALELALVSVSEATAAELDVERLVYEYAATSPPAPDWGDKRSLAAAVLAALRFLLRRRRVRVVEASALARIHTAAETLDWVDIPTLVAGIERLLGEPAAASSSAAHVHPPDGRTRLTARQRGIISDLAAACDGGWAGVKVNAGDTPENRLRLNAALTSREERWADDRVAGEMIGGVLRELSLGAGAERPLLRELAALGLDAPAIATVEPDGAVSGRVARSASWSSRPSSSRTSGSSGSSRDHGVAEVNAAAEVRGVDVPTELGTYSDSAGVALLIRAALDLRVSALASAVDFIPGREAITAALMGLLDVGASHPDPALNLILDARLPDLSVPTDDSPRRAFESGLLRALGGRRLLEGDPCVVVRQLGDATALIGGIEVPALWPLTQIVRDPDEVESTLRRWQQAWSEAIGATPPSFLRLDDPELPLPSARADGRQISPAELTMIATGQVLIRAWGQWIPGLGRSSLRYMFDNFIDRRGTVRREGDEIRVTLERRELDAILELSGLLAPIDARRSLGVVIHFELTAP
jgi:hypothetical protein